MLRLLLIINVVVCVVLALLVGWRGYELWLMYGGGRDADANALIDCVRKLGGLHSGLMEGGLDKAVLEYDLNARPVVDKKVAYGYDYDYLHDKGWRYPRCYEKVLAWEFNKPMLAGEDEQVYELEAVLDFDGSMRLRCDKRKVVDAVIIYDWR